MSYGAGGGVQPSDIRIDRVLNGLSTSASQEPTGLGEANQIQIEFGPAQNTESDAIQLLTDGTIQINETGLYRVKITLSYGRTGGTGDSEIRFRALVNGVQAGQSVGTRIDNAKIITTFGDEAWLNLPAGVTIQYQLMRDSSGNNSGGLHTPTFTAATAASWNDCANAAIRVERWT